MRAAEAFTLAQQVAAFRAMFKAERRARHAAMAAAPSARAVIAAAPEEHRRAAYEAQLEARPNASASTRRKWARAAGITAALVLALLVVGPAFAQVPTPEPTPEPVKLTGLAGGLVSLGGGTESPALTPMARIAVEFPLSTARLTPHLHVTADLSALPGEALQLDDPTTFRALQFTVGASQRLSESINAAIYAQAGFATRLGTDPEPRDKAPRYWNAGLRFAGELGWLQLGAGMDQRLGGDLYQPAGSVSGAVRFAEKSGVGLYLVGEAILGFDLSTRFPGRDGGKGDSIRVGVAVGGGR